MAALWTVEYVGGAIRVRRHRSQADAEAYRDAVLRADGRFSPIAKYDGFDYASGRSFWRRRSLPSLLCEWLGEWFRGVRAARMGYSTWLYVQCSGGCMIPMDMLNWDTDWID